MQTWRNDTKLARAAVAFSLAAIPAAWVEITLTEGRNRQVRRMTAAVGHPTLRLIRVSIGSWSLDGLEPGEWNTRH